MFIRHRHSPYLVARVPCLVLMSAFGLLVRSLLLASIAIVYYVEHDS